jgi:hypothetical protein
VEVVAAGAAQTRHLPGVFDDDLVGWEHGHPHLRPAVDDRFDAVPVQPVGVLAAASEGPTAGHAVAAPAGGDRPGRVEGAGHDDIAPAGEDRIEGRAGQAGQVAPAHPPDHHRPAHGGVGPGQRLDHPQASAQVGPGAVVRAGEEHPEAAGVDELSDQVGRHAPGGLDLGGPGRDHRAQLPDCRQHCLGRGGVAIHDGHGLSLRSRRTRRRYDWGCVVASRGLTIL